MKYYKDFKPADLDLIAFMETYRREGTDGIEELTQLQELIGRCTVEQIWKLIDYNTEVAVEILINCKGNADALEMYEDYLTQHKGWITGEQYAEVCQKYESRLKKAQEVSDARLNALNKADDAACRLNEDNKKLRNEVLCLKARLFDAYEAGYSDDKENY